MRKHLIYIYFAIVLLFPLSASAIDGSRTFNVINASDGLIDNSAQTILCTPSGRMIVTTIGHINIYDGNKFSHYDSEKGEIYRLANYNGNYHLYFDEKGFLWLKNKQIVACLDLTTEIFVSDIGKIFREYGVSRTVDDLFVDSDGKLWLVSDGKLYGDNGTVVFDLPVGNTLQDFEVIDDRAYCFYSNGEVYVFSKKTSELLYNSKAYDVTMESAYERTSVVKRCGDKIFQIRNGVKGSILMWLDATSGYWTIIKTLDYKMNNMAINQNKLYVASAYGYWTYNIDNLQMNHYENLNMVDGTKLLTDINVIQFDKQNGMWIGTEQRGLLYSKPISSPFKQLTWDSPLANKYAIMMDNMDIMETAAYGKNVNCAYKDSRGWTWVGTYSGLKIYKPKGGEPSVITKRDGLMNEVIHSIIEDKNNNIWVTTSHGISCVVMQKDSILNVLSYIEEDNVPTEMFLVGRSIMVDTLGTIAMQAIDHVVTFNPNLSTLVGNPYLLKPQLVKVLVNGNEIRTGSEFEGHTILDKSAYVTRELNLNYNHNSVVLTFSSLNYFRPLQTYYKVKVSGIHDDWKVYSFFNSGGLVDKRGLLHLPLMGLLPGVYKVEVMASMYPYSWNGEPLVFTININEPWWRTRFLYLMLAFTIIVLVIFNVVYYNRNYRIKIKFNNEEQDVIKRLRNFVDRCDSYKSEILAPREGIHGNIEVDKSTDVDKDFVQLMLKILPEFSKDKTPSLRNICNRHGIVLSDFYELISANVYKNPRSLVKAMRLEKSCDLLLNTEKDMNAIFSECGFATMEYYSASFVEQYGMTPQEYRFSFKD